MAAAFREAFQQKDFVVTAEVGPPKGTNIAELIEHIDLLKMLVPLGGPTSAVTTKSFC